MPPPGSSRRVAVNLDRSHFREARWRLLAEGILLLALSIAGLIAGRTRPCGFRRRLGLGVDLDSDPPLAADRLRAPAALSTLHLRTTLAAKVFGKFGGLLLFAIGTARLYQCSDSIHLTCGQPIPGTPSRSATDAALWVSKTSMTTSRSR